MSHGGPPFFPLPIQVFSGFKHITDEKNGLRDILNELYGLASGGGGEDLAATLAIGNTMGAGQRIAGPVSEDMNLVPDAGYGIVFGDPTLGLANSPGSVVNRGSGGTGIMRVTGGYGGNIVNGTAFAASNVNEIVGGGANFLNAYVNQIGTECSLDGYGNIASVYMRGGATAFLDAAPLGFAKAEGTLFLGRIEGSGSGFRAGGAGGKIVGGWARDGRRSECYDRVGIAFGQKVRNYYGRHGVVFGFDCTNTGSSSSIQQGLYNYIYYSYAGAQVGARHYAYSYQPMQFGGSQKEYGYGFRNFMAGSYNYLYFGNYALSVFGRGNTDASDEAYSAFGHGFGCKLRLPQERQHGGGRWMTGAAFVGDAPVLSEAIMQVQTTDAVAKDMVFRKRAGTFGTIQRLHYPLLDDTLIACVIEITARSSTGAVRGYWIRQVVIDRAAGVSTLVSTTTIGTDENASGLVISITVDDPTDVMKLTVTGLAETAIQWMATIRAQQITLT